MLSLSFLTVDHHHGDITCYISLQAEDADRVVGRRSIRFASKPETSPEDIAAAAIADKRLVVGKKN